MSRPDLIHLATGSPLLNAAIVVRKAEPTRVVITTYLFYRRPRLCGALWTVVGPLHRRIAPYLLERAAARPRSPESLP